MAASILFAQDTMSPFADSTPVPKHPPQLHLTPSKISVDHWLSQQYAQRSTTHHAAARDMSNANHNIFAQSSNGAEDLMNGYTFTTEHHGPSDEFAQWSAPSPNSSYPVLHLQTQQGHQQRLASSAGFGENWNDFPSFSPPSDHTSSPSYLLTPNYSPDSNFGPISISSRQTLPHTSPIGSDLSLSPLYPISPRLPSPSTPGSATQSFMPSPTMSDMNGMNNMLLLEQESSSNSEKQGFTHREQLVKFRDALSLPMDGAGPFVPQPMYKPHTTSDRKRYVEEVLLEAPLYFVTENSQQYGILLKDALHFRTKKLRDRDQVVFEGRGPSVSIRLEWPGYRQWSRQIPTKDFRSPPQPITLAKLAKNVAKCVQRFMLDRKNMPMEEDADSRWKIGDGPNDIKLEDLVLVSIHHVSLGSWQPQLRLVRPRGSRQNTSIAMPPTPMTATNATSPMVFPQLRVV